MLARDLAATHQGLPIAVTSRLLVSSRPSGRPVLPMTADVDVRSQDPSWIHGTPVAKQCAGIGEASDRRQQQDAGPASAPTKEAPSGSIEITIPTTHSQTFADETNNIAVEVPLTQPREDSSVPVPGSRRGKRIYYLALVQCDTWTQEDYNRRFIFVKNELQSTVNGDPDCRDRAPYVSYELRMVGTNRDQAVPSIVVNCRERDTRSLKSLFARADKKLGRGKGSLTDRLPWAKPQTILIPPLPLVYCGFKGGPVTQKMSDEPITAHFGNESTYCGGLLQYQGASATLGLSLYINSINAQLTVDHVFRSKRSVEPIVIPAPVNSPSDTPYTTLYDVDMDSLNDLCENDGDDIDSQNGLWENDDDEYDYEDEPESGVEDETSDSTFPGVDMAAMKPSEQWEKIITPETIDPSLPYLDWVLVRPLPRMGSPPRPIGFVNALFPDGPGGRPVVISQIRDEPPVHLAPVYVISGVRGVLCGHILASSTFLGSPAKQADGEVWTIVLQSPQGLISGECGSVVVDQKTHEAYGHVIGCNPWGHALVVPLRHVLSQVKVYFRSTRVGLTSFSDVISELSSKTQPHQVYRQDDLSFVKQVLATGEVEVNSRDNRYQTPLHRWARAGNEAVASLLPEHGLDKEAKGGGGQTPLHLAAEEKDEAIPSNDFPPLFSDGLLSFPSGRFHSFSDGLPSFPSNAFSSNGPARDHRHRDLGEIDGFLAGMRYIDETESGDGPLELVDPSKVTTLPPFIPRSANEIAWSCIRDLRDSLQSYWQHFVKVSQNLDHAIINRLYEDYKDASGLQEAGVFAFRNTMIGPAPNDLKKIFAFCSLSYATSRLLHAKGRFEKTEIMAGVSLWLRALENPGEQEAFKILAHSLWPETRSHIDFFDQGPTIQGLDFRITDFVGQEPHNFPDDTLQGQLAGPGHDQFGALGLSPMPIVSPDITKQHISIPSVASIWTNDPRELHHTKVFDAVVQYCRDNGDFWYNLSDQGAISKDIRSLLTWNQQCAREKKLIYEQYMEHLLLEKDTKDVTSRGIVSVAKRFIDTGYLQSTDEAKTYMIKMASLIFTDSRAHERFITWITGFKYPFLCPTCHREFSRKYNMERHYEDVHNRKARKEGARAGGSKPEMPVADSL